MTDSKSVKHATVSVLVFTSGAPTKVLLLHHKKTDQWQMPGGHIEDTENPLEAAIREVESETGIDVIPYLGVPSPLDEKTVLLPRPQYLLEAQIPARGKEDEHYHLDMIYVVHIPEQTAKHKPTSAHDIGWFERGQLDTLPMAMKVLTIIKLEMAQS